VARFHHLPIKPPLLPDPATVVNVQQLTDQEKLLRFKIERDTPFEFLPCQFVMLSFLGMGEAPISITSGPCNGEQTFDLCVRAVGSITNRIHDLTPGDQVGIRGPYGNGFPIDLIHGRDMLFIGGGLGLAPLRSLVLWAQANRSHVGKCTLLYGAKTPEDMLFRQELDEWANNDLDVHVTVDMADSNWFGQVGVITTLFDDISIDPRNTIAMIVGPPIMYKYVIMELLSRGLPESRIHMSLERRMRCGVGKCGHCQMNSVYVCQDGPVFCYRDVKKLREAL
jgi:sulfhydrogenase subunit gamma (sulfur reductase)